MINTFRTGTLGLGKLSFRSGPSVLDRLKVSCHLARPCYYLTSTLSVIASLSLPP